MSKGTKYEGHTPTDPGHASWNCAEMDDVAGGMVYTKKHQVAHLLNGTCDLDLIADAPALLACALELRRALVRCEFEVRNPHAMREGSKLADAAIARFDALTGVEAARAAGKGGGK